MAKIPIGGSVGELVRNAQSNGFICKLGAVDCGTAVGMGTGVAGIAVGDNTAPLLIVPVALIVSVPVTATVGVSVRVPVRATVGVVAFWATTE